MNARGSGPETSPPPADATPERRGDATTRPAMRAAPPDAEDQRGDEPDDEPGYGHGV